MPFGKTFWAKGFGMGTDKFGIPWMVNCGQVVDFAGPGSIYQWRKSCQPKIQQWQFGRDVP
jgi:hypothetical protein